MEANKVNWRKCQKMENHTSESFEFKIMKIKNIEIENPTCGSLKYSYEYKF